MGLRNELESAIPQEWDAYIHHDFVRKLGEGTLPLKAYRDYLIQDYLYLRQFARANAIAIYKSHDIAEMQEANTAISNIIHEMTSHKKVLERWGVSTAGIDEVPEKQVTIAYTRYVLDIGMAGTVLDLDVALAPCTFGYAEIGLELKPKTDADQSNPYREWVEDYASDWYQTASDTASARLDELEAREGGLSKLRRHELIGIFATATRLEADFWQQALDVA